MTPPATAPNTAPPSAAPTTSPLQPCSATTTRATTSGADHRPGRAPRIDFAAASAVTPSGSTPERSVDLRRILGRSCRAPPCPPHRRPIRCVPMHAPAHAPDPAHGTRPRGCARATSVRAPTRTRCRDAGLASGPLGDGQRLSHRSTSAGVASGCGGDGCGGSGSGMIGCGTTGSGMIGVGGSPGRGSRNGGGTSGPGSVAVEGARRHRGVHGVHAHGVPRGGHRVTTHPATTTGGSDAAASAEARPVNPRTPRRRTRPASTDPGPATAGRQERAPPTGALAPDPTTQRPGDEEGPTRADGAQRPPSTDADEGGDV